MSTNPHHRRHHSDEIDSAPRIRAAETLFSRANPFLAATWHASDAGMCITPGCSECGALEFRRALATLDGLSVDAPLTTPVALHPEAPGPLATALATVDFALLRLTPRWYDALDIALFYVRDRGELRFVLNEWVRRDAVPTRILDLVLFRHVRYGFPDPRLSDLWIDACLDVASVTGDEGLVESLILTCPERVGADPRAFRAAMEAATHSPCVRAIVGRLGECA
jgi:hypothetical protein